MNLFLWNIQIFLAITIILSVFKVFNLHGVLFENKSKLHLDWIDELSPSLLKSLEAFQIFIALGLFLPQALNFEPWLTPIAAIGFSILMMLFLSLQIKKRNNTKRIAINIFIIGLSLFVAFSRLFIMPF